MSRADPNFLISRFSCLHWPSCAEAVTQSEKQIAKAVKVRDQFRIPWVSLHCGIARMVKRALSTLPASPLPT